nr:hypothetical protein [Tanacetum cinerariifolium]
MMNVWIVKWGEIEVRVYNKRGIVLIITEATIREALRLDDAESIDCLPNEEIFIELSRMGYEKPFTNLTFYKAFFSLQWKFLIHTILQCMSAKRTSWNEFSSSMASAVIRLSTGRKFNFSKYIFDSLVRNVDSSTKFYMYPRFLQLMIRTQVGDLSSHTTNYSSSALTQKVFANMRRVGKGFFGVDTPLFEGMIVAQQADDVADKGAVGVDVDVVPAAAEPSIPSPTLTTQPPPPSQELPSTSQVIPTPQPSPIVEPSSPLQQQQPSQPTHDAEISMDLLHTLMETYTTLTRKVEALKQDKVAQAPEIIQLKHRVKKLERKNKLKGEIRANMDADEDVTLKNVAKEVVVKKDAEIKENADVQGRQAESQAQIYKIDLEHADKRKEKEDNAVMRYQALKRKPQTEVHARKNIMIYLRNMVGFKIDYFKGMSYDDIRPIFKKYFNSNVAFLEKTKEQLEEEESRALKRKIESQAEKKKQKLDEEVEELRKHLQIVPNDEDDVYTEATPLARKVSIIDYEIYTDNNKPYYKIIRADGSS